MLKTSESPCILEISFISNFDLECLPSFGPSFVHFYQTESKNDIYLGSVLVSLQTETTESVMEVLKAVKMEVVSPLSQV